MHLPPLISVFTSLLFANAHAHTAPLRAGSLASRADAGNDAFRVTSPAPGDTLSLDPEMYGKATLAIEWSVPAAIGERPVMLSLSWGDSAEELAEVELIASGTENNGSYTWTAYLDDTAPSGCNYTIVAKCWTSVAYSGYFTIVNSEDGGLEPGWACPVDEGRLRPGNGSYEEPVSAVEEDGSRGTTSGNASSGNGDVESESSASTSSESSSSSAGGGGGVSTTTLAIAVVIPIVALLIIFATVLVLGIRRGWFLRKQDRRPSSTRRDGREASTARQKEGDSDYPDTSMREEYGKDSSVRVGELHGHDRPHQSGGNAVFQLYGDEGRR